MQVLLICPQNHHLPVVPELPLSGYFLLYYKLYEFSKICFTNFDKYQNFYKKFYYLNNKKYRLRYHSRYLFTLLINREVCEKPTPIFYCTTNYMNLNNKKYRLRYHSRYLFALLINREVCEKPTPIFYNIHLFIFVIYFT